MTPFSSPFSHEKDVDRYLATLMKSCEGILLDGIEHVLKEFCDENVPKPSPFRMREAAELLAFCDADDEVAITEVVSKLGRSRMPAAGIAGAISEHLRANSSLFLETLG